MRLADKVALITASGSGMGRAGAILFAREGAKVIVADIAKDKGEETVALIRKGGGDAAFIQVDLSKNREIETMAQKAERAYGKLHVLWNHAGIPGPEGIEDVTEEEYDRSMALLVKGGFFVTKHLLPLMRKSGGGSIIFTSSIGGMVASPFSPVYAAGKGAVVNLTRSLAVRLAPQIRVNCICPGPVDTPMLPLFFGRDPKADPKERLKGFLTQVPLGRVSRPEEIATAALFLASDESSFMTGVIMPVDGGITTR